MADELENKELLNQEEQAPAVDGVPETQQEQQEEKQEELPAEQEPAEKEEAPVIEEQVEETQVSEDQKTEEVPPVEEEVKAEEEHREEQVVEEEKGKEVVEEIPQSEEVVGEEEENKDIPAAEEDIEKIKKELAEKEAELEEEKAIKSYEDDVREANNQLTDFLNNLGTAMANEFAKYGIDVNANLDELKKQDPAKARLAEQIIAQAQQAKAVAMNNVQSNLNERLTDVVFTKASRLFDRFDMTPEETNIAAETFVNILEQTGIKDMGDDLVAKVELAVARAKMIAPKVEKVGQEVKEIANDVADAIKDVAEAEAPKEEKEEPVKEELVKEEPKKEEEKEEKAKEAEEVVSELVESKVEAPSLDEFKESAVISNQAAGDSINEDNVMQKLAALPSRERTAFYKEHFDLINRAAKKETIRRAGNYKA